MCSVTPQFSSTRWEAFVYLSHFFVICVNCCYIQFTRVAKVNAMWPAFVEKYYDPSPYNRDKVKVNWNLLGIQKWHKTPSSKTSKPAPTLISSVRWHQNTWRQFFPGQLGGQPRRGNNDVMMGTGGSFSIGRLNLAADFQTSKVDEGLPL